MPKATINPNLTHLISSYRAGFRGGQLEGSSRSGKTIASVDFIVYLTSKVETNAVINIIKESQVSFRTTLYNDFNKRLPQYGIQSPFAERQQVSSFKLFGNTINLLGADDPAKYHGAACDYFYINEILDTPQSVFDQSEQRCAKYWWCDYNPKATMHWVYDRMDKRTNIAFKKTTFRDNPWLGKWERAKILSYEPTPENIAQGTADDYMWNVYGLGLRSAPEGLIFQNVEWVSKFPANCEHVMYGIDWGYTNDPTVLTKIGIMKKNMFIQILHYAPTPSFNEVKPVLDLVPKGEFIWADPSGEYGDRGLITLARKNGYRVYAFKAFPGSIKFGITLMKGYKIHLIDHPDARKEQANYKYHVVNGIKTDEPVDAFNHMWDSARGACLAKIKK